MDYDIALVQLQEAVPVSESVAPVKGILGSFVSFIFYLRADQGIFRKESPAAAASDDQDQAQQDPGAQLLSVDTPKEGYHSEDLQKSCEACTEVPDSSHWVLVEPDVSTEKSVSTYSLSSPAGRYECSESGLRWSCAGQVILQYRFTDWQLLAGELPHMQYRPAGPSMDIKLISGELQEIHLPHFLCLGGSQSCLKDAVMVLHKQDSGVCLEKCELSRFHARLVNPSFSLLGLFYSLISLLLPGKEVKIHADVQVYLSSTVPFTFRAYLLPADAHLRQLLDNQELKEGYKGVMLAKGRPENPLQMNEFYVFKTTCNANICPGKLNLRRSDIVPNFSEVHLSEAVDFKMELLSSVDQQQHWEATIWKNECFREKPKQGGESTLDAADFLSRHRAVLIQKVQNVIQIADHMLSQNLINEEVYANIRAAPTEQEKMRRVFDALVSHGAGGKREFLGILQRECPDLLQELGR
ncbi:NACHT, LRR and PYD domains-containing protein 1 homolog [Clupea harengus]|uniref:NACHT, LRR and PYD domains-containing protein 1 homolog n=1 Tax=Clupea harengus TaxID=7950 RepID=A0A8M1KA54_CLUHA|nr:NACHT, LRR and PYD domains-containing protein 1 homolog [Clupea harengus]